MRSIKTLTTFAVVMSLISAVLVFRYVSNTEERILAELQPTKVLIAVSDIDAGSSAATLESLTREVTIPRRSTPDGALSSVSQVKAGTVALTRIMAGSYVFAEQFGDPARLVGGLVVPINKVVLTLDLKDPEQIGKFVRPGASVAVYSTSDGRTDLLVARAAVIAIGDQTTVGTGPISSSLVTLALSAADAKRVLSANQSSQIQLALVGEGAIANTTTVRP